MRTLTRPSTRSTLRSTLLVLLGAGIVLSSCRDDDDATGPDAAFVVQDRANDFIASYAGPRNADLDVRRAEVTYDGTNFVFTSTLGANVGTTTGSVFVWGVDRGAGTARFGDIATGVHFDAVVVALPDGTGSVRDLTTNVAQALPAGSVTITGASLRISVPATLLPSKGFSLARYTANFWPRSGTGNNNQIADFAPDNGNVQIRMSP